jgi:serine/threonine protein kinase/Tol biopolymer transport system component
MSVKTGTRLGPYEVLSTIGAGGMGEVYRARDTRLDRIVAIKVLPTHLADRSELRERFEREARTIASLNHPHICTLHDIGLQDGIDYLVMEHLEGETLAQRLQKGALPLEQVLLYAIEISDALDKAHRKGVTHRDLKPGNIMLTKTGAKLLDFGLAKLKQEATPADVALSDLPTGNDPLTAQGAIVGTLQYMAPEQLEGKEVDARTDIFAFGAVVYEMATRKRAFEGNSQASVISAIMTSNPPPMSSLQPMTPPVLDRVVKRCLAKEPDGRWQSANDLTNELKWIAEAGSQIMSAPTKPVKGVRALKRRPLIFSIGALIIGAVIASLTTWNLKPSPPQPVSRLTITLPPGQQLAGLESGLALALSPEGTHLAYVVRQGGVQQIYLRALDSLVANPLPGTEGGTTPFFSPDSQWVGFFVGGRLKKVSVTGGVALDLGNVGATVGAGASWSGQGIIAIAPGAASALLQVPDAGGAVQARGHLENGDVTQRWPEFLPGGRAILFTAGRSGITFGNAQIAVQSVGTGGRRDLVQGASNPRYAPSGHLVYAQGGDLEAVPFDPQRLAITGVATPVVEGVLQSPTTGAAQYSIAASGTLAYIPGGLQGTQSRLIWVSRNGTEQVLAAPPHSYRFPRLSPDGRRVGVAIIEQESQIWLYDLSRETLSRFTFEGSQNYTSVWTPDGKRVAFESNNSGSLNIFWQLADGSGGLERLTTSQYINAPGSWSPDGSLLAFAEINTTSGQNIWILRLNDRKALPFHRTGSNENEPRFSPNGSWLAYISDESGRYEVYVQPYPGPGGKWQISTEGGTEPVWNQNGRELFYRNGDKIMVVDISTQPGFYASTPRVLFQGRYEQPPVPLPNFDVSRDGQHFLMLKPVDQEQAAPTQINIVLNWFEELKQKVPTGKK